MIKTVDVSDCHASLSELVSLALEGNEIIIEEDNKPVARLVPILPSKQSRVPGLNRGQIWTSDDFDEPLPDSLWTGTI